MPYFSRLTDIVTCSLTDILAAADDAQAALSEVIFEMEQGIAGAQRSMKTAAENEARIRHEIDEQRAEIDAWVNRARQFLSQKDEEQARLALLRKHEVENLVAALEMQLKAAASTREQLTTTFHALESRLADARRRLASLESGASPVDAPPAPTARASAPEPARVTDVIDVELEALKRELGAG